MDSKLNTLVLRRKQKEENRKKSLSQEEKRENVKKWTSFYRRNMNIYAERHLGIKLHPFQHIMLYLISISDIFFAICSRGISKK